MGRRGIAFEVLGSVRRRTGCVGLGLRRVRIGFGSEKGVERVAWIRSEGRTVFLVSIPRRRRRVLRGEDYWKERSRLRRGIGSRGRFWGAGLRGWSRVVGILLGVG